MCYNPDIWQFFSPKSARKTSIVIYTYRFKEKIRIKIDNKPDFTAGDQNKT